MIIKGMVYGKTIEAANKKLNQIKQDYESINIPVMHRGGIASKYYGNRYTFENGDAWLAREGAESARGYRWNVAYIDTAIDKDVIDTIIKPAGTLRPFTAIHYFNSVQDAEWEKHFDDADINESNFDNVLETKNN